MSMNIQSQVKAFLRLLNKHADEKYREGNAMAVTSGLSNLGVGVPVSGWPVPPR